MGDDANTYTETTAQSWGSRIWESAKGIVIGLLLVPCSVALLSWNEERAVERQSALISAADLVVSVQSDRISPENEGKLIHVMGRVSTEDTLQDPDFQITVAAIKLIRWVETYQWLESSRSETRDKLGGGSETITTYTYSKGWASGLSDSNGFKKAAGHENPSFAPFGNAVYQAETVTLGAFHLSDALVGQLNDEHPVPISQLLPAPPQKIAGRSVSVNGNELYLGNNPSTPEIGDSRVWFTLIRPADISIMSQQFRNGFVSYATPTGDVELIEYGLKSPQSMIKTAEQENSLLTWGIRLGGFLLMLFGFKLIFAIVEAIAAIIPPLGWITGSVLTTLSGILAAILSLATIGTAWIAQRPVLGIGFGSVVIGGLIAYAVLRRKSPVSTLATKE